VTPKPVVYVEWTDAVGCAQGWDESLVVQGITGHCVTVGFLLDESDEFILVASTYTSKQGDHSTEAQMGGVSIPKAMIERWWGVDID